ncbi:MAG: protein-L-isoaspartate O-methyltransferase, partial [Alphaproteobacteria bacterium]
SDYSKARHNMVESQIRPNAITDPRILAAMMEVPREIFVPSALRSLAYMDEDVPLESMSGMDEERYLLAPLTFARLLQAAEIQPGALVLDIGCATGYSTTVIARLAEAVVGLEQDEVLAEVASKNLVSLQADNAAVVVGELRRGYPDEGPYDAIILEGSVEEVPQALFAQLKNGGSLAAVVVQGEMGRVVQYKNFNGDYTPVPLLETGAPPLPGFQRAPEFVF